VLGAIHTSGHLGPRPSEAQTGQDRTEGWGDPALLYDEENDLFRFRDGRFAFSREWADWPLLRKRGRMMEEL
jgi:hypothetical protein